MPEEDMAPTGPAVTPNVMTVKDLAAYLQVSERSVYNMAADGECPAAKVAGQWRFHRPDIDAWLHALSFQGYRGPALTPTGDQDDGNV